MASDKLFKELCRPHVMKIGWHLAQGDSRDDFVRDPVSHADYASGLTERLQYLIEQVEHGRYRPRHLIEVDVPKSGLSVRPGNVLPIEESSLLHAIVYLLGPLLDKSLDEAVYSYRLHKEWRKRAKKGESLFREREVDLPFLKGGTLRSLDLFDAWYERWPDFERDSKAAMTEEGFTHLTKTDISSYFENIDIRLLHDQIRSLLKREEEKILQLLFRVLEGWTRSTSAGMPVGRGIPQGNDVSSFLGNIYLVPLDRALVRFCKKHDAKWFRYVDDVKVFTRCEQDARAVVFEINQSLRALHLNLQGSKTEILSGERLARELDTSDADGVEAAFESLRSIERSAPDAAKQVTQALKPTSRVCSEFTRGLPASVRDLKGQRNRLFRRILTLYGLAGRSRRGLPQAAIHSIRELPDLRVLASSLRYLAHLEYRTHDESTRELLAVLEGDQLLFPYQVGAVLGALVTLHPKEPNGVGTRIRAYAFGPDLQRKHDWLVYVKGLEALSSFPYREKYFYKIVRSYASHHHPMVRRAALAAMPRCPKHQVRALAKEFLRHPDGAVARLATYWDRLITERAFALQQLSRLRKGSHSDQALVRQTAMLYSVSATEDKAVARELLSTIDGLAESTSAKLNWIRAEVRSRSAWAAV